MIIPVVIMVAGCEILIIMATGDQIEFDKMSPECKSMLVMEGKH
jgi:hypothetical protein